MTGFPAPGHAVSRASIFIAAFSTIVEWYDFTLYLYFATVLSRVMFGGGHAGLIAALAAFAAAYLLRPLGAMFFGHVGDRSGRRRTMLISVAIMTATMLATALLPSYRQAGAAAGWLLFLLRCVMGFSVGGEYSVVVAYLLEGAAPHRRGMIASLASAASEVGGLLAVGISSLTVGWMSTGDLDKWGWRIPFLFGAVLAGSVWIARSRMEETPEFQRHRTDGTIPANPLHHVLANHPMGIVRSFAISALGSITYYVGITYVPVFLTSAGRFSESDALRLSIPAAVAVILVTPLTGVLSDRFGRKPILILLAGLSAILPVLMFWMMADGSRLDAIWGAVILAALAGAVSAIGAVATAEQFPVAGRVSGLALGATSATVIFGGVAPYAAQALIQRTGQIVIPGALIAAVALCVLPVLLALPETRPQRDPAKPPPDPAR